MNVSLGKRGRENGVRLTYPDFSQEVNLTPRATTRRIHARKNDRGMAASVRHAARPRRSAGARACVELPWRQLRRRVFPHSSPRAENRGDRFRS